ncbi:Pentatricopeptide repeat-containing protein, partial [Cucurbita argyrosperma subsp. argyrosperma]
MTNAKPTSLQISVPASALYPWVLQAIRRNDGMNYGAYGRFIQHVPASSSSASATASRSSCSMFCRSREFPRIEGHRLLIKIWQPWRCLQCVRYTFHNMQSDMLKLFLSLFNLISMDAKPDKFKFIVSFFDEGLSLSFLCLCSDTRGVISWLAKIVFDRMPARDIVFECDKCLRRMRSHCAMISDYMTEYYDTCERSSHLLTFCNTKDGNGYDGNVCVVTAIIDSYAKSGYLHRARLVCDQFKGRSLIIWTAIISAYAANGGANVALSFFYEILTNGIRPDSVAFTPVCSCAHSGELDEAWKIFNVLLPEYGIQPLIEHYACMVGVLSLAEKFSDAVDFISKMPIEPTTKVWDALLNGASVAGDVELGKCVFDSLLDTEPENTGNNIIMDNLYSLFGRWKKSG